MARMSVLQQARLAAFVGSNGAEERARWFLWNRHSSLQRPGCGYLSAILRAISASEEEGFGGSVCVCLAGGILRRVQVDPHLI